MKYSQLFGKTLRDFPAEETSRNAKYLIKAGFINKRAAGVYEILPLGKRVVEKIANIVREEMNQIGGQEIIMSALQPKEIWDETGRWEKLKGAMYQFKDSSEKEFGLGFTHEEPMTALARERATSYKDLPLYLYQIQAKFRDEPRPRSGLIRGREFLMKDLYSFCRSKEELDEYYELCAKAYKKVFDRLSLPTIYTEAAGGVFTKENTHEFQVIADGGEDTIYYCEGENCGFSQNKEIASVKAGDKCQRCAKTGHNETIKEGRAVEVGNIFRFGDVMSKQMNFYFTDKDGKKKPVFLGSYGIGITRSMAAVVEVSSDDKGIIWPEAVSPYRVYLINIGDGKVREEADKIYESLQKKGLEVLYDDREESPGVKLADSDLVGLPERWVVSEKTLKENSIEVKKRSEETTKPLKISEI
ncbi:MAG: aminoacyl--tRNA ligase-related protein [Candidatus Woykebacteria bacterium]